MAANVKLGVEPPLRLVGSRQRDGEDDNDSLISIPDLAIQVRDVRPDHPPCLAGADLAVITIALLRYLRELGLDNPYFPPPICLNSALTFGVWITQPVPSQQAPRDRGLRQIALLQKPQDNLGLFFNFSFINWAAGRRFMDPATPKRYSAVGVPDETGPIHLTGIHLDSDVSSVPAKLITKIFGFDEQPWPDVSFTINIADPISSECVGGVCPSDTRIIPSRTDEIWTGAVAVAATIATLGLFTLTATFMNAVSGDGGGSPSVGGAGQAIMRAMPLAIPLPRSYSPAGNPLKFPVDYSRAGFVTTPGDLAGGVYATAFVEPAVARTPSISIAGPVDLDAPADVVFKAWGQYTAALHDTYGNVAVTWGGDGTPDQPAQITTAITFLSIGGKVGTTHIHHVRVQATDSEGTAVSAELAVRIHLVRGGPPASSPQ